MASLNAGNEGGGGVGVNGGVTVPFTNAPAP